jgi:hypothetical protein
VAFLRVEVGEVDALLDEPAVHHHHVVVVPARLGEEVVDHLLPRHARVEELLDQPGDAAGEVPLLLRRDPRLLGDLLPLVLDPLVEVVLAEVGEPALRLTVGVVTVAVAGAALRLPVLVAVARLLAGLALALALAVLVALLPFSSLPASSPSP